MNLAGPKARRRESGTPRQPSAWATWVGAGFGSVVCLAVSAACLALLAGVEAAEPGMARVLTWGMAIVWLPVLWIVGEILGQPVLGALEQLSWWKTTSSPVRVVLGVIGVLPFFAFMVWCTWVFRRWFGVEGW